MRVGFRDNPSGKGNDVYQAAARCIEMLCLETLGYWNPPCRHLVPSRAETLATGGAVIVPDYYRVLLASGSRKPEVAA
jgi:hypothetical protein